MNEEFNEKHSKLALAAVLVEKMRLAVFEQTGFRCSAGIAANKMLAKLSCGKFNFLKNDIRNENSLFCFFFQLPPRTPQT